MQQTRKPRCRLEIKKKFDVSSKMARVSALIQINLPSWFRENGWVDRVAIDNRHFVWRWEERIRIYRIYKYTKKNCRADHAADERLWHAGPR